MESRKNIFIMFFYLLVFTSIIEAKCDDDQIDINSASSKELDKIVWIGPATAEKIVDGRPFDDIEDLDDISGIGEGKLIDIINEGLACVEEEDSTKEDIEESRLIEKKIVNITALKKMENSVVFLENDKSSESEIIYKSKNWKVAEFLPYIFGIFLIFIIGILIFIR